MLFLLFFAPVAFGLGLETGGLTPTAWARNVPELGVRPRFDCGSETVFVPHPSGPREEWVFSSLPSRAREVIVEIRESERKVGELRQSLSREALTQSTAFDRGGEIATLRERSLRLRETLVRLDLQESVVRLDSMAEESVAKIAAPHRNLKSTRFHARLNSRLTQGKWKLPQEVVWTKLRHFIQNHRETVLLPLRPSPLNPPGRGADSGARGEEQVEILGWRRLPQNGCEWEYFSVFWSKLDGAREEKQGKQGDRPHWEATSPRLWRTKTQILKREAWAGRSADDSEVVLTQRGEPSILKRIWFRGVRAGGATSIARSGQVAWVSGECADLEFSRSKVRSNKGLVSSTTNTGVRGVEGKTQSQACAHAIRIREDLARGRQWNCGPGSVASERGGATSLEIQDFRPTSGANGTSPLRSGVRELTGVSLPGVSGCQFEDGSILVARGLSPGF